MSLVAIVRDVASSIERCELTHIARERIDLGLARLQHENYIDGLRRNGVEVVRLEADEAYPDGCFVEDTAVVLDELAVLTMPGSASRRGEVEAVARALEPFRREIARVELPATLDGGDVLVVGRRIYVGLTSRTNAAGVAALRRIVSPHGYDVAAVAVPGCLHLKSAVTAIDERTLLANRAWLDAPPFDGFAVIEVAPGEPGAANVLRVGEELWAHPGYPRTFEGLRRAGLPVVPMDISEFVKAEAALTCKSLLFRRG
ncbi:MAG TPA: arginine deiminase-related protein [Vicinamibacteria bacterium]|nr:arginine deiminase-related protein [Vicinamibacteria bacterium]